MMNILIVHYNTPKLTECLVRSINKYVGKQCTIYIFDNSDEKPFTYKQDNIVVFDNTQGQIINFENWLSRYKAQVNVAAADKGRKISARHCISVDKCFDLIDDNFILLDSDVLLTSDISSIYDEEQIFVGGIEEHILGTTRLMPYCCFINVNKCKSLGIRYFDEEKMHGISEGNGNKYDTGAAFYLHTKDLEHKIIDLNDYIVHYKGASWDPAYKNNVKYHIGLTPELWLIKHKKHYQTEPIKRVIYTCITGGYEKLVSPTIVQDDFDYVCFTDDMKQKPGFWELRPIPQELKTLSSVKQQRMIKICPHKYLPEYDESIWIDASIDILCDMNRFLNEFCDDVDKSVFIRKHPSCTCLYTEAMTCANMKKDTMANMRNQIARYKQEGFPQNFGLTETNIVYRKHHNPYCVKLMNLWAHEILHGSHRDQLSFNYALWKIGDNGFKYIDFNIFDNKYFKWYYNHDRGMDKNNESHQTRKISKLYATNINLFL